MVDRLTAKQKNSYTPKVRKLRTEDEKRPKKIAKLVHSAADALLQCCKKLNCTSKFDEDSILAARYPYLELSESERFVQVKIAQCTHRQLGFST